MIKRKKKCMDKRWIKKNFCQQTCFDIGDGYVECSQMPIIAPSQIPSITAHPCDDKTNRAIKNIPCRTIMLEGGKLFKKLKKKCKSEGWRRKKKNCRKTCYDIGQEFGSEYQFPGDRCEEPSFVPSKYPTNSFSQVRTNLLTRSNKKETTTQM